jgi:diguanylate cyclase (GGDEF)-like protein
VWANQKARNWLSLSGQHHVSELSTMESRERLRNDIMPLVRRHGLWTGELTLRTSAGEEIPVVATLQAHRDEGDIVLVSTIAHDITELKQIQHRLRYEATHDPLTGLPNRSLFRELGEQALARAERHGSETAVLFLDLDGFKHVNDTLGHAMGDTVLVEIAARLRIGVRSGDVIARIGGDEFCVLCERVAGETEAKELARRLVDVVSVPLLLGGHEMELGTSIGVAIDDRGDTTIEKLIRNADVGLYQAKRDGRGQVACFSEARDR